MSLAPATLTSSNDYRSFVEGTLANPFDLYAKLRASDPVHWSEALDSWVLTRYTDCQSISQADIRISSDRMFRLLAPIGGGEGLEALHGHLKTWLTFMDPPVHTQRRDGLKRELAPSAVQKMAPRVSAIVDELLNEMETRPDPDLIRDFAFRLPATVVCELLGIPSSDLERLQGWSHRIMRFFENVVEDVAAVAADANEAVVEVSTHLRPLVEERRRLPQVDLISLLVHLVDTDQLTEPALYGWCILLLVAGHETTTGLIGNSIATFLQLPDAREMLRNDPSKIDRAIEEVLRFDSPVDRQTRLAIQDLEIDGHQVRAGERIYAFLAAANRDPEAFSDPDRFDIDRWPNRHLGFGYGVHFCIGAYLARLEARTAVTAILGRYPDISLAGTPTRWRGQTMRRYDTMPIDLGGGQRS